jgi:DNA repair protein RecO (recombination protein O)
MITKTDAVVLKSMRYRDTSRIVTFYTRKYGKLKAIAKGARDAKSKFGASLEPMTLSSLVLYKKEQRELQFISQCDIVRQYKRIHSDIGRMAVALSVIELVNQLTQDEEENLTLFSLLVKTLDTLEKSERMFESLFYAFEIRVAGIFGFGMHLEKCVSCGKRLEFSMLAREVCSVLPAHHGRVRVGFVVMPGIELARRLRLHYGFYRIWKWTICKTLSIVRKSGTNWAKLCVYICSIM